MRSAFAGVFLLGLSAGFCLGVLTAAPALINRVEQLADGLERTNGAAREAFEAGRRAAQVHEKTLRKLDERFLAP